MFTNFENEKINNIEPVEIIDNVTYINNALQRYIDYVDSIFYTSNHRKHLVIYDMKHCMASVLIIPQKNTPDICQNNLRIFVEETVGKKNQRNGLHIFYLFVGTFRSSYFLLQKRTNSVFYMLTHNLIMDNNNHFAAVKNINSKILGQFVSVFFADAQVRGPLKFSNNGEWLKEYQKLMDKNNVGIVVDSHPCTIDSSVRKVPFLIKSSLLKDFANLELLRSDYSTENLYLFVHRNRYNMSSFYGYSSTGRSYVNNNCDVIDYLKPGEMQINMIKHFFFTVKLDLFQNPNTANMKVVRILDEWLLNNLSINTQLKLITPELRAPYEIAKGSQEYVKETTALWTPIISVSHDENVCFLVLTEDYDIPNIYNEKMYRVYNQLLFRNSSANDIVLCKHNI